MAEFLLEIFQEEIPARMQAKAVGQLLMRFTHQLDQAKLRYASLRGYVTPLRLVLVIEGLEGMQSDRSTESKGPLLSAPEKAIAGFLRNHGLADIADCDYLETPKGTALLYRQTVHGQTTVELLPAIIATVLRDFSWTNEMRFANQEFRWVRPLRQVLAVYDGVALEGSLDLGGQKQPFAQELVLDRFRSDVHPAPKNFAEYKKVLSASGIVLSAEQRQAQIRQGLEQLARAEGCIWYEDRFLLDEVAGLVEQVHVLHGSIEARFMTLPDAVLRLVIRTHQKYFVFNELDGNCLSSHFALVTPNPNYTAHTTILAGNQRVLRARLQDAEFFLSQDQRISLLDHAARLKDLRFVEGLGSMYDKAERVGALFTQAPAGLSIESGRTLALLAKADLVTEMVGEFPELQGVIGAHYARVQGETTDQALAIEEHYAPKGPANSIPSSPLGCALALMDKLDTIAGFAAKDALPKGSGDPFAIRRAMLGVIRIMVANDWLGHLLPLLHRALAAFGVSDDSKQYHKLIEFYRGRMVQHLRDQGIDHGVALAAMDGEIAQTVNVARALYDFISTDAGQSLKTTYVRAQGLLRQVGAPIGAVTVLHVARENLNVADCALWDTAQSVGQRLEDDLTATARFALLGELSAPLDNFFESVLINTEDTAIKGARLDILRTVVNCVKRVANFDRLISG